MSTQAVFTPAFMLCYVLVLLHSVLDCGLPYKMRGDNEFRWLGDTHTMTMSPPPYLAVEASLIFTMACIMAAISIFDDVAHAAYHVETPTFHCKTPIVEVSKVEKPKDAIAEQRPEDLHRPWRRAQQRNVKEWNTAAEGKAFPFELCTPMMGTVRDDPAQQHGGGIEMQQGGFGGPSQQQHYHHTPSRSPFPVYAPVNLFPDTYRQRVVPNLPEHIREFYHGTSV